MQQSGVGNDDTHQDNTVTDRWQRWHCVAFPVTVDCGSQVGHGFSYKGVRPQHSQTVKHPVSLSQDPHNSNNQGLGKNKDCGFEVHTTNLIPIRDYLHPSKKTDHKILEPGRTFIQAQEY